MDLLVDRIAKCYLLKSISSFMQAKVPMTSKMVTISSCQGSSK